MAKLIVAFMCVLCCIGYSTMTLSCYLTTSSESEAWLAKDIKANRQHHTQYGLQMHVMQELFKLQAGTLILIEHKHHHNNGHR